MIEVFSNGGSDGRKVCIVLEELNLAYAVRASRAMPDPLGEPVTLHDPDGPGGAPILIGEAPAIAFYLTRKTGKLGPETLREQVEFEYLSCAMARLSANLSAASAAPSERGGPHGEAAARQMEKLDDRMATRHFLIGERYTALDALLYPCLLNADIAAFANLDRLAQRLSLRAGVKRAMGAFDQIS